MPEFQGGQFLPLMQEKWRKEEEQREPFGKGLVKGLEAGMLGEIQQRQERKKSQYDLAIDVLKEQFKRSEPVKINPGEPVEKGIPLDINEQMQLMNTIASGGSVPPGIGWREKEQKTDRPVLWRNEKTGKVFNKDEKGGLVEVSAVPYNALIYPLGQLPADIQKRAENIRALSGTITTMKSYIDKIPSAEGWKGRAVGGWEELKSMAGENPDLNTYLKYCNVVLGQIATTIGGETGSRLSDQDVKRMKDALPMPTDTTTERKNKWNLFMTIANQTAESLGGGVIFPDVNVTENKKSKSGGTVMTDKNGDKAIVYTDGTFEEIK